MELATQRPLWRQAAAWLGGLAGAFGVLLAVLALWDLHVSARGPDSAMAAGIFLGAGVAAALVALVLGLVGRLPRWALLASSFPILAIGGEIAWEATAPARLRVDASELQSYVGRSVDDLPPAVKRAHLSTSQNADGRTDEFYGIVVVSDGSGRILSIRPEAR